MLTGVFLSCRKRVMNRDVIRGHLSVATSDEERAQFWGRKYLVSCASKGLKIVY